MKFFDNLFDLNNRNEQLVTGLNKELKEDCFAGRFKIVQTLRIDHHIEDDYYTSIYRFTFIDTEQPERIIEKVC